MSNALAVFRKEVRGYLASPIPYVLVVLFTALSGVWVFFIQDFFLFNQASLASLFDLMPWAMIFFVPAVSMRIWSEETRGGTLETLMTLPVSSWSLVLGKFLGAWVLLLVLILATTPLLVTVALLGDVDAGPVWSGYLGAWLMGGALLGMGLWVSALTRHQIVAFLVTMVAAFLLVMLRVFARSAGDLGPVFESVSVASRYAALGRGIVDLRDVVYFLSFMGFFLYLNAEAVENRRYR